MKLKLCLTCGAAVKLEGDKYVCPFCGNEFAKEPLDGQYGIALMSADDKRQSADFEGAKTKYEEILKKYPKEVTSQVYWGLFLCEQSVLFEQDAQGETFPSFLAISDTNPKDSQNYRKALECAYPDEIKIYEKQFKSIVDARQKYKTIKANTPPYDVFICFKKSDDNDKETPDKALADEIYNEFAKDYHVFYSEKSLKDIVVRQYEPNIYYGLYTAKVMLLLCSKSEYINSKWVKNEWSRFLKLSGSNGKMIVPVFMDGFSPENLPSSLQSFQGVRQGNSLFSDLASTISRIIFDRTKIVDRLDEFNKNKMSQSAISVLQQLDNAINTRNWDKCKPLAARALQEVPPSVGLYHRLLLVKFRARDDEELVKINGFEEHDIFKAMQECVTTPEERALVTKILQLKKDAYRGAADQYTGKLDLIIKGFEDVIADDSVTLDNFKNYCKILAIKERDIQLALHGVNPKYRPYLDEKYNPAVIAEEKENRIEQLFEKLTDETLSDDPVIENLAKLEKVYKELDKKNQDRFPRFFDKINDCYESIYKKLSDRIKDYKVTTSYTNEDIDKINAIIADFNKLPDKIRSAKREEFKEAAGHCKNNIDSLYKAKKREHTKSVSKLSLIMIIISVIALVALVATIVVKLAWIGAIAAGIAVVVDIILICVKKKKDKAFSTECTLPVFVSIN